MAERARIDSAGEMELGRRLLWAEALRAGGMAVLWLSLAILLAALYSISHSRGAIMPGHLSLVAITLLAALHQGACLWITRRRLGSVRPPSRALYNYLNSFVEVSWVSLALLILLRSVEPALAMLGVPLLGYFLLLITSSLKLDSALCAFVGIVASAQYGLLAWLYWDEIVSYYPPGSPIPALGYPMRVGMLLVSGIAAGLVSWLLRRTVIDTVATATAHAEIVRLFGEHVSPGVVDELLARPDGEWSEVRPSAVLVADLRGFTRYAETRAPSECVGTLNALWAEMVQCVEARGGIINKFLGDGFLAVFGVPAPLEQPAAAAVESARDLLKIVARLQGSSPRFQELDIGVAVHYGNVLSGLVGAASRREFTVIGDVVNLAFRMEQANKEIGSRLVVSAEATEAAGIKESVPFSEISVPGRKNPVRLSRLA
ncbi:MAG TPA: adenylate/guanylate cyclase domain-containing protein [Terrimicrobiaceae bacterium]|nr:adenylate/guanylate cyclase domain-containing protein [Terrimicrobiaceae bacterium]